MADSARMVFGGRFLLAALALAVAVQCLYVANLVAPSFTQPVFRDYLVVPVALSAIATAAAMIAAFLTLRLPEWHLIRSLRVPLLVALTILLAVHATFALGCTLDIVSTHIGPWRPHLGWAHSVAAIMAVSLGIISASSLNAHYAMRLFAPVTLSLLLAVGVAIWCLRVVYLHLWPFSSLASSNEALWLSTSRILGYVYFPSVLLWQLACFLATHRAIRAASSLGCCSTCGYRLFGNPHTCPECGSRISGPVA